jgi:hypothetical protein
LANEWGFILDPIIRKTYNSKGELDQVENTVNFAKMLLRTNCYQLQMVVKDLKPKFGTWQIPWGEINRFQRPSGDKFDYDDTIAVCPIESLHSAYVQSTSAVYKKREIKK